MAHRGQSPALLLRRKSRVQSPAGRVAEYRISEGGSSQNTTLSHALSRHNNSGDGFIHRQKTKHELPVVPQSSRHYHHEMIYSAAVKHETYFSAASMDAPTGRASAESISGKWNFRFSFDNENSDEVILFCRYF